MVRVLTLAKERFESSLKVLYEDLSKNLKSFDEMASNFLYGHSGPNCMVVDLYAEGNSLRVSLLSLIFVMSLYFLHKTNDINNKS